MHSILKKRALKRGIIDSDGKVVKKIFHHESYTSSSNGQINLLPIEILTEIFSYLPLRYRKNAKLVCQYWNLLCNTSLFLRIEKLIICPINDLNETLDCLKKSKRDSLNVEFMYINFKDCPLSFWQSCGERIHSLRFSDCILKPEFILHLLTYCVNLTELSWTYEFVKPIGGSLCSNESLESLLQKNISNKNLNALEIHVSKSEYLSNYILNGLFALFPNIKKLALWCNSLNESTNHDSELHSQRLLSFACILNKIKISFEHIENLRLELHRRQQRCSFAWETIVSSVNFTGLKEVTMEIDVGKVNSKCVIDFLSKQKYLESVKCRIIPRNLKEFISLLFTQLLNDCPRLRHVQLSSNNTINVSHDFFVKLVSSPLETLCIQCRTVHLHPDISKTIDILESWNYTLRTLHIIYGMDECVHLAFLNAFRNLKYLELHEITDKVLQTIWKYQTNLVSLKLFDCEYTSDFGFIGLPDSDTDERLSIRRLQKLEYLEIEAVTFEWKVTSQIFAEFIFPNLRYFSMDIESNFQLHDSLLNVVKKLTNLEAISISCQDTTASIWIQICSGLSNLRFLRIGDEDEEAKKFTESQYHSIFHHCPSLRIFVHGHCKKTTTYILNTFKQEVVKKSYKRKYRVHSEKLGVFFVDWMWF